ncbi:Proton-dependent oligopeptide transporter family protein [Dioscorea alata]|uniref:Proton-dependent oligopeptide transporter family protein n=1 Tax=Dioscorea alata TaxID=55571 RepID=A0ACB7W1L3_DIOAL|nr:Proton-dependent oligopeptide transporter family protein [Dioscorea alata]
MAVHGFVDWKGNPINKKQHGGVRAACFIYFLAVMLNMAYVPNILTLVTYLHGTMHTGVASSSTIVTNFIGATCAFALLGAFLSDSYISRLTTIFIFGPFELLGFGLLALQAHFPSLHPPTCDPDAQSSNCRSVHGFNSILLYIALYTIALGEGCIRASLASLGADQFDTDDPVESRQWSSFFNWYTFGISSGAFSGLILIVWLEDNKGWDIGFAVGALLVLLGLLVLAFGFPYYRNQRPQGSPLTRVLQVFVVAFKNRKLTFPETLEDVKQEDTSQEEVIPQTKDFKFLEKASIYQGKAGGWSYCSINQVEETKIILRMIPVLISSIVAYITTPLLLTFSVQQGGTMNTRIGKIHIAPASLMLIPVTFQMIILVVYDQFFVPFARKITGYTSGITSLQRIGIGFLFMPISTCMAALVEMKRKHYAEEHGEPMSVFWLSMQFFILGINDVTNFVGLLEFFNGEVSRGMKSIGTAIFWCAIGLPSLLGSVLVNVVNKVSRNGDREGTGWLEGKTLNESQLDKFYWLMSVIGVIAFFNYLVWARKYVYRHNPRISVS